MVAPGQIDTEPLKQSGPEHLEDLAVASATRNLLTGTKRAHGIHTEGDEQHLQDYAAEKQADAAAFAGLPYHDEETGELTRATSVGVGLFDGLGDGHAPATEYTQFPPEKVIDALHGQAIDEEKARTEQAARQARRGPFGRWVARLFKSKKE